MPGVVSTATPTPGIIFLIPFASSMNLTKKFLSVGLALIVSVLAACSRPEPRRSASPPEPILLSATLVSPKDIKLTWKDSAPNVAGHIVEFATDPQGEFTTLGFFPPDQNTFTHPDLMPETTWYYRVRAYYGPASNPVEVALPDALSDKEYASRFARPEDYSWAPPRTIPDGDNAAKLSIRSAESATEAAPASLKATLVPSTVSGFQLTWTDHASDEDGYLVEMKPSQSQNFAVRAVLDHDTNAFGYAFEPPERRAAFRVRAFYYGQPSNLVHETTGAASPPNRDAHPKARQPKR